MQIGKPVFWLALAPGLLLAASLATAETYKWTDAEGKVHYSDQPPPPSVKDSRTVMPKKRSSHSGPAPAEVRPAAAAPAAKTPQELDAEFRERQVKAAEKEAEDRKKAAENEEKKRNCDQARANVARLQAGGRIARANARGETEYLDDQQIAEELAGARKVQDSWCQ
ncbi:MAG TPA: DUF4124 domain-containing protein [Burkholderiales bacterium]|jgi:hypothetical protein|nr:DUF4124 domain-containing protein [Burkholderiales bacterium]